MGELPRVRPTSVTVTGTFARSVAPAVVMTMEVVLGAVMALMEAPPDKVPPVGPAAKKLMGWFKVMIWPGLSALVGVKVNVAGTLTLPATRKAESMVNEIEPTAVGEQYKDDQNHVDEDATHCPSFD